MKQGRVSWWTGMLLGMLLVLLVPVYAQAAEGISVSILELKANEPPTKLSIRAAVTSTYQLDTVTASIGDRETGLTRTCAGCEWTGELPIEGLSSGPHTVTLKAVDIFGSTGTAANPFTYDLPPVVTRLEPVDNHMVIRDGSLHVVAEAEDDMSQPSFFVQIGEDLRYPDFMDSDQGAGRFDRVYDVSKFNGRSLQISYSISDGSGEFGDNKRVTRSREVHVESSPELEELERVIGAEIVDADESRLLVLRDNVLLIRSRTDGAETEIARYFLGRDSAAYRLTPTGAVFLADTGWYEFKLFQWSGGKLSSLDVGPSSLTVEGQYAAVMQYEAYNLLWINTSTGETRSIPYSYENQFDLESDGTLLLEPRSGDPDRILRYNPADDSTEVLVEYAGAPKGPVTDGQTVLFTVDGGHLMKYGGGTVTTLVYGEELGGERLAPQTGYQVNQGWIAYQRPDAQGAKQVYLQSPEGTVTQVTYLNSGAGIHSLDTDGLLILQSGSQLYQYQPGQEQPTLIGGITGTLRRLDGQLTYLLGDTIFGLKSQGPRDTGAPQWPSAEVLTVSDVTYKSALLRWEPAVDDTGVHSYWIYRDGNVVGTVEGSVYSYEAGGLYPENYYGFSVIAKDAAGHSSAPSNTVGITTPVYNPQPNPALALAVKPGFIEVGSTLELQVRAERAEDLYGFLARVTYNQAQMKLQQVQLAKSFGTEGRDAVLGRNLKTPGEARLAGALLGPVAGRSGEVQLVTLKFKVEQQGTAVFTLGADSTVSDSEGHIRQLGTPLVLEVQAGGADLDKDGQVGLSDLVLISRHSGLSRGQEGFNPLFDLNLDGVIDSKDVQYVAGKVAAAAQA